MEPRPTRYTQHLPADLTHELSRLLDWRSLYEAYTSLPEYRRYDDPQHRLWRELYRRDLSTYPPPADIREQYFWGQALIESLDRSPSGIASSALTLTKLGYDIPLRQLMPQLESLPRRIITDAIAGGYLSIVELVYEFRPDIPVLNYAAINGDVEIFDRLFEFVKAHDTTKNIQYCNYLYLAAESSNIQLMSKMLEVCAPLTNTELENILDYVEHISMLRFIVDVLVERDLLDSLDDVGADHIMAAAVTDCDLEHLIYARSLDASVSPDPEDLANCSDPRLHEWVVENLAQSELIVLIPSVIQQNPGLVGIYLDALTEPVDAENSAAMFESAMGVESLKLTLDLVGRLLDHPYIQVPLERIEAEIVKRMPTESPALITYLLSKLPHERQLRLLSEAPPEVRACSILL